MQYNIYLSKCELITMQNKNQLKSDLESIKTVRSTMNLMRHNPTLFEGLESEFVRMVKDLQVDLLASLNAKENQDSAYDRIKETEINEYLDAFIVFCDINRQIGGL